MLMAGLLDDIEKSYPGLLGKLEQTWPSRMAQAIYGAVTLPHDVFYGTTPVIGPDGRTNPEVINRASDLAGMVTLGAGAFPAEANSLRSGMSYSQKMPPKEYIDAYQLGQKVREIKSSWNRLNSPTGSFLHDWAYGHINGLTPEQMTFVEMRMDPSTRAFYESGVRGLETPVYTAGSRYGYAPSSGKSHNYADDIPEHGVSMASVDHPSASDYTWYPIYSGKMPDPVSYEGWLLPFRGSDNEPLMVGLKPKK